MSKGQHGVCKSRNGGGKGGVAGQKDTKNRRRILATLAKIVAISIEEMSEGQWLAIKVSRKAKTTFHLVSPSGSFTVWSPLENLSLCGKSTLLTQI